jgi:L-fuconolactonase
MSPLLDAHAHFFFPGYVERLPENCRRRDPNEITLYQAHAKQHEIDQVLAIGYEGEAWAAGNNDYLAQLTSQHSWVRPVAFVADLSRLTIDQITKWQSQHFVGISLYIFTADDAATLSRVPGEIWQWLAEKAWMISVNSSGELWSSWQPILANYPQLSLLIAHLGLPTPVSSPPSSAEAKRVLASVTGLAGFANTHVKFSGFYALAQPGHGYPQRASWPYAEVITEAFGTARILWASDFSPALEVVSFPQTVDILKEMPWLTQADLTAIYHDNLANLLRANEEKHSEKRIAAP